ncbi:hypothetical protein PGTUg99_015412 [Puccinia graminis f. sp. tritici]|uniref:Uncharacterized protein n=1 Tax=Puccinia graminis f. sp. tritici TaxID=56615 RepID=A0A5B0LI45_PUCGR|nr:hypothetical protein PGTUg99_015412 [Puccinia graminis f. sp. tritici]
MISQRVFLLVFQAVQCMCSLYHMPEVLPDMKSAKISIDPHLKTENQAPGIVIPDKEKIIQDYISTYPELQYQNFASPKEDPQEMMGSSGGKKIHIKSLQAGFMPIRKEINRLWKACKRKDYYQPLFKIVLEKSSEFISICQKIEKQIGHLSGLDPINPSKKKNLKGYFRLADLTDDILARFEGTLPTELVSDLNKLLHDIEASHNKNPYFSLVDERLCELQRIILQMVYHMFENNLINNDQVKQFFGMRNTLELVPSLMLSIFHNEHSGMIYVTHYPRSKFVLRERFSPVFKNLLQVLEGRQRREFLYFSMKAVILETNKYTLKGMEPLTKVIFEDDILFHMLEEHSSCSKEEQDHMSKTSHETKLAKILGHVIKIFLKHVDVKAESMKVASFQVLEFIEENYGQIVFEMDSDARVGPIFKHRYRAMSSSFYLIEELNILLYYLKRNKVKDPNLLESYYKLITQEHYPNIASLPVLMNQLWGYINTCEGYFKST